MTALAIVAVGLAFAIAAWDVGRRFATARALGRAELREEYSCALQAHKTTHEAAIKQLVLQVQGEVDSMSRENVALADWVKTKIGMDASDTPGAKPHTWQIPELERRAAMRAGRPSRKVPQ